MSVGKMLLCIHLAFLLGAVILYAFLAPKGFSQFDMALGNKIPRFLAISGLAMFPVCMVAMLFFPINLRWLLLNTAIFLFFMAAWKPMSYRIPPDSTASENLFWWQAIWMLCWCFLILFRKRQYTGANPE
jgi:hypothetical protein